jgi:hypothetical protein
MPDHIFHVERLTTVTFRNYEPDTLSELVGVAWVLQDTIHTDSSIWRAFDEWFQAVPDEQKEGGQYRVIQMSETEHGFGTFSAHTVKPSWKIENEWIPKPADGEANGVTQVA